MDVPPVIAEPTSVRHELLLSQEASVVVDKSLLAVIDAFAPANNNSRNHATKGAPVIECARRRVVATQTGLDTLATNEAVALLQLEYNREATLAARVTEVQAGFALCVDIVRADAAAKRAALETELVAIDAALCEMIDAAASHAKVSCWTLLATARTSTPHAHFSCAGICNNYRC